MDQCYFTDDESKGKRIAVLQSNYIPWKGYFDIIHSVDLFIFYDEVQYTSRDWRNRNLIKTANGLKWLTVPVGTHTDQAIDKTRILDDHWQKKHWKSICGAYQRTPYFYKYRDFFEEIYMDNKWGFLYQLNRHLIKLISKKFLNISTTFADSREFSSQGTKHDKLLSLVKNAGADVYFSGPAAKNYIDCKDYEDHSIALKWMDYSKYPKYPQLYGAFEHGVSILDLLFNVGDAAGEYIWGNPHGVCEKVLSSERI